MLPTKEDAAALLRDHVSDEYHLHHALMVAMAMEGYAYRFATAAAQGADAAVKIDRSTIQLGCDKLGISLDEHISNQIQFLAPSL